jgi:hypothetical protein
MSKQSKSSEPGSQPDPQREALRRSEKKADEAQPENFKDAETAEKIVEIGPDLDEAPIKGIDPAGHPRLADPAASSSLGEEDPNAAMDDPAMRDAMRGEARAVRR